MRSVKTLIDTGRAVRGVPVRLVGSVNPFEGVVDCIDRDGYVVVDGPYRLVGPPEWFEVTI